MSFVKVVKMSVSLAGHLMLRDGGLREGCDMSSEKEYDEGDEIGVGLTVGLAVGLAVGLLVAPGAVKASAERSVAAESLESICSMGGRIFISHGITYLFS